MVLDIPDDLPAAVARERWNNTFNWSIMIQSFMNKRYSGDWMVLADDRILEYLSEVETATPGEMVKSGFVRYSNGYVSERCQKMSEKGLVNNLGRGVYAITERGEQYLRGEIDTSEDVPDRVESSTEKRPSAGDTKENV